LGDLNDIPVPNAEGQGHPATGLNHRTFEIGVSHVSKNGRHEAPE